MPTAQTQAAGPSGSTIRPYRTHFHGTFEEEWGLHRGTSEWWYITGVLREPDGHMFSYQVTLLSMRMGPLIRLKELMLALTDADSGVHHYTQVPGLVGHPLAVDDDRVAWGDQATIEKTASGLTV